MPFYTDMLLHTSNGVTPLDCSSNFKIWVCCFPKRKICAWHQPCHYLSVKTVIWKLLTRKCGVVGSAWGAVRLMWGKLETFSSFFLVFPSFIHSFFPFCLLGWVLIGKLKKRNAAGPVATLWLIYNICWFSQ